MANTINGREYSALYESLLPQRASFDSWATTLRDFIRPFSPTALERPLVMPDGLVLASLWDATAVRACERLAAAHQSNITTPFKRWFELRPSVASGIAADNDCQKWFSVCQDTMFSALAESNFYEKSFEAYNDRVGFGTGCLYAGVTDEGKLTFSCVPFGSYVCAENEYGDVNLLIRCYEVTAVQAVRFHGVKSLPMDMLDAYNDEKLRYTKKFEVLHTVREREKFYAGRKGPKNMPYESVYVERSSGAILEESGMEEFPFLVTRFLKLGLVYGYSPGMRCFSDIVGIQRIARIQSILAELQAFPRVKQPAELDGRVNFRPGGVTTVKQGLGDQLKEWGTVGNYPTAVNERAVYEKAINDAFFINDLQVFEAVKRQMTATEAAERADERLSVFAQTFCQFISDLRPVMGRIFNLLYRAKCFPKAPGAVLTASRRTGNLVPQVPEIVYTSKFAQKMREIQNQGMATFINMLPAFLNLGPEWGRVLDLFDEEGTALELARGVGYPEKLIRSSVKLKDFRERKAADAAQAQAMAAALQGGGTNA